jgi:uncharacterized protein (TIGR00251 family)
MTSYTDAIKASNKGVLLCLHVIPGSSQTVFPVKYDQWRKSIEIKVKSEAKDNKANTEVIDTIAGFFRLSAKDVVLVSGEKNREKTVCLKRISIETVNIMLMESLHG